MAASHPHDAAGGPSPSGRARSDARRWNGCDEAAICGADWREDNGASWDERAAVHLGVGGGYDLGPLRAGHGRLDAIAAAELGPVARLRVLHPQCHFGKDTLTLAPDCRRSTAA